MEKTCIGVLMFGFLAVGWLVSCSSDQGGDGQQPAESSAPAAEEAEATGTPVASVETDKGIIVIELLSEVAPATVERFIELAEVGFYRRTSFHRVMKDRMIQGGDPLSRDNDPYNDGQGTSGEYLPQEFSSVPFERGTVAMGRLPGGDNGGSCQFFITLKPSPEWDGQYNVFGRVIEGIEVAEEISRSPLSKSDQPSMKNRPAGKQIINRISVEYR
jgi:cyclophilin family peptidyl-prolyl cis-trans isomerase